ncbi:hypothetical protein KSP39_PZI004058 [Platanthera zijinensis]|uniref:Ribosomal protein S1 n=1 Tax=Platanthera zijinensis TaxID=2320716 RepID=A0AAP0BUS9_9ASPA
MMSIYWSQSFPISNSGFLLCSGNASQSLVLRFKEKMFLVDLVAGESLRKEQAATRFPDFGGSLNVLVGEPLILLPRRFRKNQAWVELKKIWQMNKKFKGFLIDKVKGGYSVAIAGFITFIPFYPLITQRIANVRFTIESINPKRTNIVVFQLRQIKQEKEKANFEASNLKAYLVRVWT